MIAWMRDHVNLVALWVLLFGLGILLSMVIVAPAYAATEYSVGPWKLVRSGVTQPADYETHAACDAALRAQPVAIGSTVTFRCQQTTSARGVRDPRVCSAQPAPITQPGACPTGTAGTWTQTAAFVSAPYPQCWTQGPFVPQEPPAGACTASPPPTGDWTHCANQNERCSFTGTRTVRYGAIDANGVPRFAERDFTDGVMCNNAGFGMNPAPDLLKTCSTRGAVSPPPPPDPLPAGTGTALLDWNAPMRNVDDTPASLIGYTVRYGRTAGGLNQSVTAADMPYTVTGLASGAWFFAVSALSASGEGEQSNVASKVVP